MISAIALLCLAAIEFTLKGLLGRSGQITSFDLYLVAALMLFGMKEIFNG